MCLGVTLCTTKKTATVRMMAENFVMECYCNSPDPWNWNEPCTRFPRVAVMAHLVMMAEPLTPVLSAAPRPFTLIVTVVPTVSRSRTPLLAVMR